MTSVSILTTCDSLLVKPVGFNTIITNNSIQFIEGGLTVEFGYKLLNNYIEFDPITFPNSHHIWRVVKSNLQINMGEKQCFSPI